MSSRTYAAVVTLYAQDAGFDPRKCKADDAARCWAIVHRVWQLEGAATTWR